QNMLDGKFVELQGSISTGLVLVAIVSLAAAGFFVWGAAGWLSAIGLLALYSLVEFFATVLRLNSATGSAQVIGLPGIVYVDVTALLGAAFVFVHFFMDEQRARRAIHRMFGKYVTPEVAQHLITLREKGELAMGGQVKQATIMFGDIRGFTTLSEGMEPEAVMAMLNRYFDKMVEIIIKHGGTISKFIGDNVMVLFNLPAPMQGNHALAACRAAFEIQEWIKQYREDHPEEVAAFGFGINTGDLVAGNMGSQDRLEYTVIGETVNVANSFCGTAERDEVAISEATWEAVNNSGVTVIDKGLIPVKGKTELIHIFSVTGVPSLGARSPQAVKP
ncbi:MAG: adenylate/guanylate cyclase domain-containing protein, partial [Chloroflexota bacterium]